MISLILYCLFGYFVIRYEKPVQFAAGFAVLNAIYSLLLGEPLIGVLLVGGVIFAYTAFVYMVVDRYGDRIVAPIAVLLIGFVLPVGAALYFG